MFTYSVNGESKVKLSYITIYILFKTRSCKNEENNVNNYWSGCFEITCFILHENSYWIIQVVNIYVKESNFG